MARIITAFGSSTCSEKGDDGASNRLRIGRVPDYVVRPNTNEPLFVPMGLGRMGAMIASKDGRTLAILIRLRYLTEQLVWLAFRFGNANVRRLTYAPSRVRVVPLSPTSVTSP